MTFLAGGIGQTRPLDPAAPVAAAGAAWSLTGWIRVTVDQPGSVVIVGVGDPTSRNRRSLMLDSRRLGLDLGGATVLMADARVEAGEWHAVAASYDGHVARLYLDGRERAARPAATGAVPPMLLLAPPGPAHFGGSVALLQIRPAAIAPAEVRALAASRPDFGLITFTDCGVGWPWQVKAWRGLLVPQDPWTLPHGDAPPAPAIAVRLPEDRPALRADGAAAWSLGAWRLAEAPRVAGDAAVLSQAGFDDHTWYPATVPGTVLTTLVDRGVYPDPYLGLDNMVIPERLAHQDYWYRTEFATPAGLAGRTATLTFKGINYAAEIWLNGTRVGAIRGAFIRGVFDVTGRLRPGGRNALAVRISPPPHPGIPSEESIAYGPGENGGNLAIDGPTFIATEGWDWIPGIRDRDTGIWQDVVLQAAGPVRLLDPNVVTRLPLPRTDEAAVSLSVPVETAGTAAVEAVVEAAFDDVDIRRTVTLAPGRSEVTLDPATFPALLVRQPRLWWPNGYGAAALHDLTLTVTVGGQVSDHRVLRFGMRHITYELSLFDHDGRLRRVEIDPAGGTARGERLVDVGHRAIKQTPNGWAASLTPAGETSPAVRPVADGTLAPFLVIHVNGVPIAARGGSWGMDDAMKRVGRDRLEPYFRLHQAANLNIIRNWLGQDTEDVFYDLADQYGLLVLNDFWESTQDFQVEAEDPALFLANARDVISRYRWHPCIALWFGRNEGVPQPILNEGLAELVATLDGTRYYSGSSNRINLWDSGPYDYRPPAEYFTGLAQGFSVEVGTPSLATLEAIEAMVPAPDRWPIGDTLAYHDWHFGGNGDVAGFMRALETQFGPATGLADFERKAQMMNYVTYRAIFEGFSAGLWTTNSGRLLWMTHPAWPSNHWQIYSSDYDTQASYYGVKKATEPVHVQMNLPDYRLVVVNTTLQPRPGLTLSSRVLSLDGTTLASRSSPIDAAANVVTAADRLELAPLLAGGEVVLVVLTLTDGTGTELSRNLYWQGRDEAALRHLNDLPPQPVALDARIRRDGTEAVARIELQALGTRPALATKLTLLDAGGHRILPAYYSDNYVTLLPGERRRIEIRFPVERAAGAAIGVRGWNVEAARVPVEPSSDP